jgi:uncharacterized protein YqeY
MSELKAKIKSSVTEAMKARDSERTVSLRMFLAAIQKKEMELRKDVLENAEVEKVLLTVSKQIQETLEQAKGAGRTEMVAAAEKEIKLVMEFLPKQMSETEVDAAVSAIVKSLKEAGTLPPGGSAMGVIMKQVMATIGSKAEGKMIQSAVKKAIS